MIGSEGIDKKYDDIYSQLPWIIFQLDVGLNFEYVNETGLNLTGYTKEDIEKGLSLRDVFSFKDTIKAGKNIASYLLGEEVKPTEYTLVKKNKEKVPIKVFHFPIFKNGVPSGLFGMAMDLTEQRENEERAREYSNTLEKKVFERTAQLRESEQKYRELTEKTNDVIWTMDMNLKLLYVSPSITKVLGFTQEERYKHTLQDQLTPDSLPRVFEVLGKELQKEENEKTDQDRSLVIELEYYHKDGSTRLLESVISGLRDSEGKLIGIHGVSRDITKRKKLEAVLKQSEQEKSIILNSMPDLITLRDTDLNLTWANTAELERLNVTMDEILGQKCYRMGPNRETPCEDCMVPIVLETKKGTRMTKEMSSGHIYDIIMEPIFDEQGQIVSIIDITRNVTEAIQLEREQEINELKTKFMSTATHEIRTPLTSIMGYIELIDESVKHNEIGTIVEYYDVLKRNAYRLSRLTSDLLDIQRLDMERFDLNKVSIQVSEFIQNVITEISPLYQGKQITIKQEVESGLVLNGDYDRLQQVMVNLLNNSIKFSEKGSVINVIARQDNQKTVISVSDNGIGISEGDIPKLFTPFPDVDPEVKGKGTGLGLSICKGILDLHDGEIWVESEGIGKGTRVCFTIPNVV